MKILHVVPDLSRESGGQSAATFGLCAGLSALGIEAEVVTTDYGTIGREPNGVRLNLAPCVVPCWRWAPVLAQTLRPLLDRTNVIHLHGLWSYPIWAAARLARRHGVPYLVSPCGMLERWSLSQKAWRKRLYALVIERHTLYGAAAIHFTSDAERDNSEVFGSRAPGCVVPLGLPRAAWEHLPPRGGYRRRLGVGAALLVLFLGRLHRKKRPDLVIRSFAAIADEFPCAVLVVAGPGDAAYVESLRKLARALRVDHRVVFPGLLQGLAVPEALVDADVFALPSLQENFALAVAEAMAAWCPVVVSAHVALAPQIEKYGAGVVTEVETQPLAEALRQLLRDKERRLAMGQNGRRLVLEHYTLERTGRLMVEVYEDMLRGTRTSGAWRS